MYQELISDLNKKSEANKAYADGFIREGRQHFSLEQIVYGLAYAIVSRRERHAAEWLQHMQENSPFLKKKID